jgi:hypothetical protein
MRRKLSVVLATSILTGLLLVMVASPAAVHTTTKVGAYNVVVG